MTLLALDIGGANIKAVTSDGRAIASPFALWKNPSLLPAKLTALLGDAEPFESILLTMTGELCDCFDTRAQGMDRILDAISEWAKSTPVQVWSIPRSGFVAVKKARSTPLHVASANWHALATQVARRFADEAGLLIDIGSTTTDLIPFANGKVTTDAITDRDRLAEGSLVYTGVSRTSVATISNNIHWQGTARHVVAEQFATMADVYTLLNCLPESPGDCDTADGKPRDSEHCANRLLRMVGSDLGMNTIDDALELANAFADMQIERLATAAKNLCATLANAHSSAERPLIVLSGSGEFLAERVVDVAFAGSTIVRLSDLTTPTISDAACAHALLELHQGQTLHA